MSLSTRRTYVHDKKELEEQVSLLGAGPGKDQEKITR